MLGCKSRARSDLRFKTVRKCNGEARRYESAPTWRQDRVLGGAQIQAGRLLAFIGRQSQALAMGQALDPDLGHALAPRRRARSSINRRATSRLSSSGQLSTPDAETRCTIL